MFLYNKENIFPTVAHFKVLKEIESVLYFFSNFVIWETQTTLIFQGFEKLRVLDLTSQALKGFRFGQIRFVVVGSLMPSFRLLNNPG
jgi:hypothetical protein